MSGDMPQLFVTMVGSTSKKHHTVTTIDSDDLVVTYSLPIHQHHVEISTTCRRGAVHWYTSWAALSVI